MIITSAESGFGFLTSIREVRKIKIILNILLILSNCFTSRFFYSYIVYLDVFQAGTSHLPSGQFLWPGFQ